jgi:putative aldouronate transport system permease protein
MSTPATVSAPDAFDPGAVAVLSQKAGKPPKPRKTRRRSWRQSLAREWQLYSLAIVPVAFFVIFRYLPMIGNVIAFRRYQPGGSIFGDEWRGTHYFKLFLNDPTFWHVFGNTIILGLLTMLFCFPLPIVLALLLNEVRNRFAKRFVQTISYMPHFLSIVVVAGLIFQLTSVDGSINAVLKAVGHQPIPFIQQPGWFRTIYVSSEVWQTVGWGTILYLAALTTVDQDLYEAARIDGASRWRQTWHVTLPGIRPTMVTLLILNMGTFLAVGFEKIFLLYNPLTYPTADVIPTYLYRIGVVSGSFSYAAAIGLFESLIGLVMVLSGNFISRRAVGTSLW